MPTFVSDLGDTHSWVGGGCLEWKAFMPPKITTSKMMHRAGELRQNQTEAEAKLWSRLRAHRMAGVQFRRQHAIGNYIVGFVLLVEN